MKVLAMPYYLTMVEIYIVKIKKLKDFGKKHMIVFFCKRLLNPGKDVQPERRLNSAVNQHPDQHCLPGCDCPGMKIRDKVIIPYRLLNPFTGGIRQIVLFGFTVQKHGGGGQ